MTENEGIGHGVTIDAIGCGGHGGRFGVWRWTLFVVGSTNNPSGACLEGGIRHDIQFHDRGQRALQMAKVEDRMHVVLGGALAFEWAMTTHVFLHLVRKGLQQLLPQSEQARQLGVCFVTNVFSIPTWTPTKTVICRGTKIHCYA